MAEKRIEKYIPQGEAAVWQGSAKENDYITASFINVLPFIIIWLAAECVVLGVGISNTIFGKEFNTAYLIMTIAAIVLHLVPTSLWLIAAFRENDRIRGEEYAVTGNQLIIVRSPLHESAEYLPLKEVVDVKLKRTFAELILGTGRIVVETDEEKITLYSLDNAVKTYKKVYRAILGGRPEADE